MDRQEWLGALHNFGTQRFGNESNTSNTQLRRVAGLVDWERNEKLDGGATTPDLELYDVLQARAALPLDKGVGVDGISAEIYKSIPWRATLHIYHLFKSRLKFEASGESPFWKVLQFLGIPKVKDVRVFGDLRWICKSSILQKWYLRALRPQLRRQIRPSWVHSYGFKRFCRTSHITSLVRQLQYISQSWGMPLLVALQDVEVAFDSMEHEHIVTSMSARGITAGMVGAHMRELCNMRAVITLPGAGDTQSFSYNKGGKQGGIETPDQWNMLVDHLMEDLILSWTMREFGFKLGDSETAAKYINHAVWADNVILFATTQKMMTVMLHELAARFQGFRLFWKPTSLEILPSCSFKDDMTHSFQVIQNAKWLKYNVVEETIILGELFDRIGSTMKSVAFRQSVGDNQYFKHRDILQTRGGVIPRIKAWTASPATSAIQGCDSWHLTAGIMQQLQTWELQSLRRMFRFRFKPDDGLSAYNTRTAKTIRKWFEYAGASFCTHRVLRQIYKAAWMEIHSGLSYGECPLAWARNFRSQLWWETYTQCISQSQRVKDGIMHRTTGHRPAWEDVFCKTMGPHWRHQRDACSAIEDWMAGVDAFVRKACDVFSIRPPPPKPEPGVYTPELTVRAEPKTFFQYPTLPHHPNDNDWDGCKGRLWIQVDCRAVAEILNGNAVLQADHTEAVFRRITKKFEELMEAQWFPRRDIDPYIVWAPREYNTVADHFANVAMDSMTMTLHWDETRMEKHLSTNGSFKLCVDGGLRMCPSDSSRNVAGFGCALYAAIQSQLEGWTYTPVFMAAMPVTEIRSAFQCEVMALEWSLNEVGSRLRT
jgi:hypothetical protein